MMQAPLLVVLLGILVTVGLYRAHSDLEEESRLEKDSTPDQEARIEDLTRRVLDEIHSMICSCVDHSCCGVLEFEEYSSQFLIRKELRALESVLNMPNQNADIKKAVGSALSGGLMLVIIGAIFLLWLFRKLEGNGNLPAEVSVHSDEVLGRGAGGVVVQSLLDGQPVAIKTYTDQKQADREMYVFRCIPPHPNIVRSIRPEYKVSANSSSNTCIALELMDMNLEQYIHNGGYRRTLTYGKLLQIFVDVANGLEHLHDNDILHRDLKPENILLSIQGDFLTAKLCDFGHSKQYIKHSTNLSGPVGTRGYMCPEVMQAFYWPMHEQAKVTPAADIYSLGIIMSYCIVGYAAFGSSSMDIPRGLNRLIDQCRRIDSSLRPTAAQLQQQLTQLQETSLAFTLVYGETELTKNNATLKV